VRRRPFTGARSRILAAFLVLLAVSQGIAIVAQREIMLNRAQERVDDGLRREVAEFGRMAAAGHGSDGRAWTADPEALFDAFLRRNVADDGQAAFTYIGSDPYRSSFGNPQSPALLARLRSLGAIASPTGGDVATGRGRVRYLAVPVEVRGERVGTFAVTDDLEAELQEVDETVALTAAVALGVLLLAAVLTYLSAGRVLAPMRRLTDTARTIGETDLSRRIEVDPHDNDEIADQARTFNAMLDRLEAAFESQRAFVSDAGHELRTPITIIRGHLELLGDDPEDRRRTIARVTDELDRMNRFVEDLLTLAKAERRDFLQPEELELDVLTDELRAKVTALGQRDWQLERVGAGRVHADRHRVTQAVMNLADNAVQHTSEGARIVLGSEIRDGEARLWIRDTGPGVELEERERIFERFARARNRPRRSDGAGLGLAIVRAIAEAHGGRVELESRSGFGAQFTLVLPAAEAPAVAEHEEALA
jgi:signal transduction histidine kinase